MSSEENNPEVRIIRESDVIEVLQQTIIDETERILAIARIIGIPEVKLVGLHEVSEIYEKSKQSMSARARRGKIPGFITRVRATPIYDEKIVLENKPVYQQEIPFD